MRRGDVFRFHYLWGHEAARGEESGRKIRSVCLVLEIDGWLYLFPITSRKPAAGERLHEVIPETECRRIGLDPTGGRISYLVLDDYNKVRNGEFYDFESLEPVGSFSPRFMKQIARRFLDAVQTRRAITGRTRR